MKRTLLGAILALILVAGVMLPAASASAETTQTKTMQIPSTQPWTDTGLTVSPGDKITITASGNVNWGEGSLVGPDGRSYATSCLCCHLIPSIGAGKTFALVGNISDIAIPIDGKGFFVGSNFAGTVGVAPIADTTQTSGKLILGFNDTGITPPEPACTRTGIDWGTWNDNSGFFTVTITSAAPPTPTPTLTIKVVKPVQVIWDCDIDEPKDGKIDLVSNKLTVIVVTLSVSETADPKQVVEIEVTLDGQEYTSVPCTVGQLRANGGNVEVHSIQPVSAGDKTLAVKAKLDGQTNDEASSTLTVRESRGLRGEFVRMGLRWPLRFSEEDYLDTATHNLEFLRATYPISASELSFDMPTLPFPVSVVPRAGIYADLLGLSAAKALCGYDKAVGVASDRYFQFHLLGGAAGVMNARILGAVLIRNGNWAVAAHELGHTYGLGSPEEYNLPDVQLGKTANGYWVASGVRIEDGYCFMGEAPHAGSYKKKFRRVWVDDECYAHLFREFLVKPPILTASTERTVLVRGIMHKDGATELLPMYVVSNVSSECGDSGDFSIQLVDSDGNIMNESKFEPEFWLQTDSDTGTSIIETDVAGFAFALPFEEGTSRIIVANGQTVVAEKLVSANPPSVNVLFPNGGETLTRPISYTLTWKGSDIDGDSVTYTALYSVDAGVTWNPIIIDTDKTEVNLDTSELPVGNNYLLRVAATDGVNSAEDVSETTFSIVDASPPPPSPSIPGVTGWGAMGTVIVLGALAVWMLRRKRTYSTR